MLRHLEVEGVERDAAADAWRKVAQLVPRDCKAERFFGRSVSLSGDRALVAASGQFFSTAASNAAYVFERDTTGAWVEAARLTLGREETEGPFATAGSLAACGAVAGFSSSNPSVLPKAEGTYSAPTSL